MFAFLYGIVVWRLCGYHNGLGNLGIWCIGMRDIHPQWIRIYRTDRSVVQGEFGNGDPVRYPDGDWNSRNRVPGL